MTCADIYNCIIGYCSPRECRAYTETCRRWRLLANDVTFLHCTHTKIAKSAIHYLTCSISSARSTETVPQVLDVASTGRLQRLSKVRHPDGSVALLLSTRYYCYCSNGLEQRERSASRATPSQEIQRGFRFPLKTRTSTQSALHFKPAPPTPP
jgi:hypothetical protein